MTRILALVVGLGLLVFVVLQTDPAEVWSGMRALGPLGALAVCLVYLAAFVVDTASWQLMLPSVRLDLAWLYRLWKIRMTGEALNLVVPAGSLGGEPIKAVLLKKVHAIGYREGAASLVMAKTVNLMALVAFAAIGFTLMLGVEALTGPYRLVAGVGLGALGLGVFGFYAVQRWRAASRLAEWAAGHRLGRGLVRFLAHIQDVDDRFEAFYGRRPGRFAGALALAFGNWVLGMAEVYTIMWFLDQPITWREAWLIQTVAELVRAGAFFIPGSLGATEAAMALLYDALTGRPALGLAMALIRRGRELLWIGWGLWFGWLFSLNGAAALVRLRERE